MRRTDEDGRVAGLSREWNDREGRVLGVDLPDQLWLEFTAMADGRTHTGPFLRLDAHSSAPIVLPWDPVKPVPEEKRALVQVILVSQNTTGAERDLYMFIEQASESLTNTILGSSYRAVTFLKGNAATLDRFVATLSAAAGRSGTDAVDLLFTTHGTTDRIVLQDGALPEAQVRDALLTLPAASRAKLRAVFSTACSGRTHLDTWIAAGFTDASGAKGIYADSAVSYAPFLTAWATELTFAEAVAAANAADVGDAADGAARLFYTVRNQPGRAAQVDSTRDRAGTGRSRIDTAP